MAAELGLSLEGLSHVPGSSAGGGYLINLADR